MMSPNRKKSTNAVPPILRRLYDPPPVAPGELAEDFWQLVMQLAAIHDPVNIPQWQWVIDLAVLHWEKARLARFRAGLAQYVVEPDAVLIDRVNAQVMAINRDRYYDPERPNQLLGVSKNTLTLADQGRGFTKMSSEYSKASMLGDNNSRALVAHVKLKDLTFAMNLPVVIDEDDDEQFPEISGRR